MANSTSNAMVFTRTFDAPRQLAWKVWTDPKHIARWWGPDQFTNRNVNWNPRPGASLHIDMVGPDGTVYPMPGSFVDVREPELLSLRAGVPDGAGGLLFESLTTVTFTEKAGKTTVTVKAEILHRKPGAEVHLDGMEEGWSQTLDRLEEEVAAVAGISYADRTLAATREFDAPRDLVWKVFTSPEHITHWWGPRGFSTTTHSMDLKDGGIWKFTMHGPDGRDYANQIQYTEVRPAFRLAYQHQGQDDKGSDPVNFLSVARFYDLGGRTRVSLVGLFPSPAARQFVIKEYGADKGQQETLARLGEHLATLT